MRQPPQPAAGLETHERGFRYYERLGLHMTELRVGAVERLRPHKPWIPRTGQDDILIRDELELEFDL